MQGYSTHNNSVEHALNNFKYQGNMSNQTSLQNTNHNNSIGPKNKDDPYANTLAAAKFKNSTLFMPTQVPSQAPII